MAFCIKDEATNKAARKLAKLKGKTLTAAVREAVENELAKARPVKSVGEKLDELAAAFARFPRTGKKADKAFYDKMWNED